ncbi:DUF4097 family beta strand repeat-containing protein [Chengkuizengella sediminis]|uniref:DUF4097 family beta strand repeat-containing protein n=1 Tax=Chengkuizengella sediminis TaxID=1885917 RepID=UPI001389DEC4|nr:DUF4097 family beta strand repeat-containing protein [Chengkuizengella sediminis]NDI35227.1 DUF4097 family beta strand repeat protein [Chengkuizengella sediminis]
MKKIIIFAIIMGLIVFGGLFVFSNVISFFQGDSELNLVDFEIEKSLSVGNIHNVQIISPVGKVQIVQSGGDQIQAQLKGKTTKKTENNYELDVQESDGQAYIEVKKSKGNLFDLYTEYDLIVKVPEAEFAVFQVQTESASIEMKSITSDKYVLKTVTGDMDVSVLQGAFDVRTDTGEILLELEQINDDIVGKSVTGDIIIKSQKSPEALQIDFDTDTGKEIIDLPSYLTGKGPIIKLSSNTGDLELVSN